MAATSSDQHITLALSSSVDEYSKACLNFANRLVVPTSAVFFHWRPCTAVCTYSISHSCHVPRHRYVFLFTHSSTPIYTQDILCYLLLTTISLTVSWQLLHSCHVRSCIYLAIVQKATAESTVYALCCAHTSISFPHPHIHTLGSNPILNVPT